MIFALLFIVLPFLAGLGGYAAVKYHTRKLPPPTPAVFSPPLTEPTMPEVWHRQGRRIYLPTPTRQHGKQVGR